MYHKNHMDGPTILINKCRNFDDCNMDSEECNGLCNIV